MSRPRNRRRLRNLLREPSTQYRQAATYFVFTLLGGVLAQVFVLSSMQRHFVSVLIEAGVSASLVRAALESPAPETVWTVAISLPIVSALSLAVALKMTHRYLGPQVSIRRHIEALRGGDYDAHCALRHDDGLQEIAADLNRLASTLRQRAEAGDLAA